MEDARVPKIPDWVPNVYVALFDCPYAREPLIETNTQHLGPVIAPLL